VNELSPNMTLLMDNHDSWNVHTFNLGFDFTGVCATLKIIFPLKRKEDTFLNVYISYAIFSLCHGASHVLLLMVCLLSVSVC
jgi:hypothetical protein